MSPHVSAAPQVESVDRYIDTEEAAKFLSLSPIYLRQLRVKGGGPRFSKITPKLVRYRLADVVAWAASRPAGASTSEIEVAHA
jgi:predicted DNA-binding transcriptional regulator AlpA